MMMNSKGARRPPAGRAQHHGDGEAEDGKEPQSLVTEDGKFFISSSVQRGWSGDSRFSCRRLIFHLTSVQRPSTGHYL